MFPFCHRRQTAFEGRNIPSSPPLYHMERRRSEEGKSNENVTPFNVFHFSPPTSTSSAQHTLSTYSCWWWWGCVLFRLALKNMRKIFVLQTAASWQFYNTPGGKKGNFVFVATLDIIIFAKWNIRGYLTKKKFAHLHKEHTESEWMCVPMILSTYAVASCAHQEEEEGTLCSFVVIRF